MGNFYVNHTLRMTDREKIGDALMGRKAFVSPIIDGFAIVYDMQSDEQDDTAIVDLGKKLADGLRVQVLAVLNHDDDILAYWLLDRGKVADSYNSEPDYFNTDLKGDPRGPIGGNAAALCAMFGTGDVAAVEAILRNTNNYPFAYERHTALLKAFGLAHPAFLFGYRYLEAGDFPDGLKKSDFIEVGGKI